MKDLKKLNKGHLKGTYRFLIRNGKHCSSKVIGAAYCASYIFITELLHFYYDYYCDYVTFYLMIFILLLLLSLRKRCNPLPYTSCVEESTGS